MVIPAGFDEEFLEWFRLRTEAYWAQHSARPFEYYVKSGAGGHDWQEGTKWSGGLSERQILEIEQKQSIIFPPDYKLFLQKLHCPDRPQVGALFSEHGNSLVPHEEQLFTDWLSKEDLVAESLMYIIEGLEFDIEHNGLWLESWGAKPLELAGQKAALRCMVAGGPKLIPICGHRFLLAEPVVAGNPVLSIHQSDIIVYGKDLRSYLLAEFAGILGTVAAEVPGDQSSEMKIPFWGEFLV